MSLLKLVWPKMAMITMGMSLMKLVSSKITRNTKVNFLLNLVWTK